MSDQRLYLLATAGVSFGLVEEAEALGMVLDGLTFIDTEFVPFEIGDIGDRAVVFTSVKAVEAAGKFLGRVRIYCISGATAAAVAEIFGEEAIVGKADTAADLAKLVRQGDKGKIVFFCGDRRRDELPSILREAGLEVMEKVVYRTQLTPHRVERSYDGIAFFSPSGVESFFTANMPAVTVPLFAIGGTTAAAIRMRCQNTVVVSERPDKEGLVRIMMDHFLNKR